MAKKLELQEGEVYGVLFKDLEKGVKLKKLIKVFKQDENKQDEEPGEGVFSTKLSEVKKKVLNYLKEISKLNEAGFKNAEKTLKDIKELMSKINKRNKLSKKQIKIFSKL